MPISVFPPPLGPVALLSVIVSAAAACAGAAATPRIRAVMAAEDRQARAFSIMGILPRGYVTDRFEGSVAT
ncbi:hypothetical protein GCM10010443_68210 [Actinoplanes cyaneus]